MYLHYLYIILPDRRTRVRVTHVHFRLLFKGSLYRYEIDLRPPITRLPKFKRKKHIYLFLNKKKNAVKSARRPASKMFLFYFLYTHTYCTSAAINSRTTRENIFFFIFFLTFFFSVKYFILSSKQTLKYALKVRADDVRWRTFWSLVISDMRSDKKYIWSAYNTPGERMCNWLWRLASTEGCNSNLNLFYNATTTRPVHRRPTK